MYLILQARSNRISDWQPRLISAWYDRSLLQLHWREQNASYILYILWKIFSSLLAYIDLWSNSTCWGIWSSRRCLTAWESWRSQRGSWRPSRRSRRHRQRSGGRRWERSNRRWEELGIGSLSRLDWSKGRDLWTTGQLWGLVPCWDLWCPIVSRSLRQRPLTQYRSCQLDLFGFALWFLCARQDTKIGTRNTTKKEVKIPAHNAAKVLS